MPPPAVEVVDIFHTKALILVQRTGMIPHAIPITCVPALVVAIAQGLRESYGRACRDIAGLTQQVVMGGDGPGFEAANRATEIIRRGAMSLAVGVESRADIGPPTTQEPTTPT